jgi:Terpene synthase family 2, C-terminal metal binding
MFLITIWSSFLIVIFRFRHRLTRTSGPHSFQRFLRHSEDYIECVAREAEYRERGQVLDMESFKHLRRENSAIRLCFGLLEYSLGIDLPDEVFENPIFESLYWAAADMVCWANVRLSPPPPLCRLVTDVFLGRLLIQHGASQRPHRE